MNVDADAFDIYLSSCKHQIYLKLLFSDVSSSAVMCRDAEDAIYERDGYNYDGYTLRVERPRGLGGGGRGGSYRGGGGGGYGGRDNYGSRGRQSGPSAATRRSDHRIHVSGTFVNFQKSNMCRFSHSLLLELVSCNHTLIYIQ